MEKFLSLEDQAELLCKLLSEKTGHDIYYAYMSTGYELPYIELWLYGSNICDIDSYFTCSFESNTYSLTDKDRFTQFVNDFVAKYGND